MNKQISSLSQLGIIEGPLHKPEKKYFMHILSKKKHYFTPGDQESIKKARFNAFLDLGTYQDVHIGMPKDGPIQTITLPSQEQKSNV